MGTVTKSIGTSSRDYSTLQAWEDALPANLVTDTNSQVGECYNDSEFTGLLVIDGHTTNATYTITLKCATGQSFRDNASVQSNALRYNQSNGVGVRATSAYATVITISDDYVTLRDLQVKGDASPTLAVSANTPSGTTVEFCILEAKPSTSDSTAVLFLYGTGCVVRNCLLINRESNNGFGLIIGSASNAYCCTIVRPSDKSAGSSTGIKTLYPNSVDVADCAIFGFGVASTGTFDATNSKYNCTDLSSGLPGSTGNLVSKTYASQFENTADATADFRAKSGGDLIDAGYTESTHGATDIAGTSRPQGAAYDIGCWEHIFPAGTIIIRYYYDMIPAYGGRNV